MRYAVARKDQRWVVIDEDDSVVGGPGTEKSMEHLAKKLNKQSELPKDYWELRKARNESEVYQYQVAGYEPFAVDNGIIYFKRPKK